MECRPKIVGFSAAPAGWWVNHNGSKDGGLNEPFTERVVAFALMECNDECPAHSLRHWTRYVLDSLVDDQYTPIDLSELQDPQLVFKP